MRYTVLGFESSLLGPCRRPRQTATLQAADAMTMVLLATAIATHSCGNCEGADDAFSATYHPDLLQGGITFEMLLMCCNSGVVPSFFRCCMSFQ